MTKILVYSDNRTVRAAVRSALGGALPGHPDPVELVEAATQTAALKRLDVGDIDLAVLDGEARPAGGIGLAKQAKDEIEDCPPVLLLVARQADAWLATWSGADTVQTYPVDPIDLPRAAALLADD
ncbi:MAG: response regulator [Propionibacteriaceae bacterium]|nr:response regulator [Propionibacteriaceae bacterium]